MKKGLLAKSVLGLLAAGVAAGCGGGGGSSNNDNGVAFTFVGFNLAEVSTDDDGGGSLSCNLTTSTNSLDTPLSWGPSNEPSVPQLARSIGCASLQNNLGTQTIRVDRIQLEYFVAGSEMNPPGTVVAAGRVLGPDRGAFSGAGAGGAGGAGGGGGAGGAQAALPQLPGAKQPISSLPGSVGLNHIQVLPFRLLPPEITEWFNLNRNSIPEPPFTMTVVATASGVTSAGDRLDTNPAMLEVQVIPDNLVNPDVVTESSELSGASEFSVEEPISTETSLATGETSTSTASGLAEVPVELN